jgi:hypothetical protein
MIRTGSPNWVRLLKERTSPLGEDFRSGFVPASREEIRSLEKGIRRTLPDDFKEFYRTFGYGQFPEGGDIYSPEEIMAALGAPIYFVTGSVTPGQEWVNEEEHKKLWLSRGAYNPCPEKFTEDKLTFEGVFLYLLLQFGTNGSCCYHQLNVGPARSLLNTVCLLTMRQWRTDVETFRRL